MKLKSFYFFCVAVLFIINAFGQPVAKWTTKESHAKYYHYLVDKSILANLADSLDNDHEENWETAFWTITFIRFKDPVVPQKITQAFAHIRDRSPGFQRALIELIYTDYKQEFYPEVKSLFNETASAKVFAMCGEYIASTNEFQKERKAMLALTARRLAIDPLNPILVQLLYSLEHKNKPTAIPSVKSFFDKNYLPGQTLVISFQRSNRDYPGLTILRDTSGAVLKNEDGSILAIPQLARSASNMSGYLTNGNTPEGIFRLSGFDVSKSNILGPSLNIQLTMPGEYKASHFYQDSTINDSAWDIERYRALLPKELRSYFPLFQSYYAGRAGRTEVIAHGTTVDPEFYLNTPYYPISPTQGCLCTKEEWDPLSGKLLSSDQVKLTGAVKRAGGPRGYYIVLNIDDVQAPVTVQDLLQLFKK